MFDFDSDGCDFQPAHVWDEALARGPVWEFVRVAVKREHPPEGGPRQAMVWRLIMVAGRMVLECRWLLGVGRVDLVEVPAGVKDEGFALIGDGIRDGGWTVITFGESDRIVAEFEDREVERLAKLSVLG